MAVLSDVDLARVILNAGFTGSSAITAFAVAQAESAGNTQAVNKNTNGSTDRGLFQINSIHTQYDWKRLYEPAYNAAAAFAISSSGTNWQPWSAYKNGKYEKFMARGLAAVSAVNGGATGSGPNLFGQVVDAAGNVIEGAAGIGPAVAVGAARSLLGLDGVADKVFTAGLGLVLTAGAMVIIALGLTRLTGNSPRATLEKVQSDVGTVAAIAT